MNWFDFTHPYWFILIPMMVLLITFMAILVLASFANQINLIDMPGGRKTHGEPVPMVGGIAIFLVILAVALVIRPPGSMTWLLTSSTILVAVGVLDDAYDLGVKIRLFAQFLAGSIMLFGSGYWIQSLLPEVQAIDSLLSISWIAIPSTLIAVVGLVNAFNMSDGIDGLASGHALVSLGAICTTLYLIHGEVLHFEWMLILITIVFAFWIVNLSLTPFKRVFLGDAGALLLGFIVAWCLIFYSQKTGELLHPVAALWCVALPVFDILSVIARRLKAGVSPFSPDRNHFHHLLGEIGLSNRAALSLILSASIMLSAFGIAITYMESGVIGLAAFVFCFLGFAFINFHPHVERRER